MICMKNGIGRDDVEKYDANSREVQTLELLAGLDVQLMRASDCLEERIRKTPNDWRTFRAAMAMITKVLSHVYDTMPDDIMRRMMRVSEFCEVVIRPRPAIPDYVQVNDNEDIKAMVNIVIRDECALCDKYSRSEWKPCEIRKMLFRVAPPRDFSMKKADICPYMDTCMNAAYGDYVAGGTVDNGPWTDADRK